jgi:hypothetical protein
MEGRVDGCYVVCETRALSPVKVLERRTFSLDGGEESAKDHDWDHLTASRTVIVGSYPIVTSQYSWTTLYQFYDHIR